MQSFVKPRFENVCVVVPNPWPSALPSILLPFVFKKAYKHKGRGGEDTKFTKGPAGQPVSLRGVLLFLSANTALCRFAAAEVRQDRDYQVGGEPDVFVAHVLIDVDENQDSWKESSEHDIGPLGNGVSRKIRRESEKIYEHHDPRGEERE